MKEPDSSLTSSIDETLYLWTDQFHRLFSPPSVGPDLNQMNHYSENCTHTDKILKIQITTEEIHSAITQLNKSKTPGSDKVCPSILKTRKPRNTYRFFSRSVSEVALYLRKVT